MSFFWFESGVRSPRPLTPGSSDAEPEVIKPRAINPYAKNAAEQKTRKPVLSAAQIMSPLVQSLKPEATFDDAKNLFQKFRYRHVPIVDETGKLVGIVSDRDVLREAANIAGAVTGWMKEVVSNAKSIDEFMTRRVLTALPNTEIRFIAKVMFEERIGAMPIVDSHGRVSGIITRSDILRMLVNNAPLELWI